MALNYYHACKSILTKAYEVAGTNLEPNQSDLEIVCTFSGLLNYSKQNDTFLQETQQLNVYELQRLLVSHTGISL